MTNITVAINGVMGRMGSTVIGAVEQEPGMSLIGAADPQVGASTQIDTPSGEQIVAVTDLVSLLAVVRPDVVVDFSNSEAAVAAMHACIEHGVRCVSGSTGVGNEALGSIGERASAAGVGVISASNFALGCVLLGHLARIASRYFDYADLIESHHEHKIDAPSGTALSIARAMLEGRASDFDQNITEKDMLAGTRGGSIGNINVHSSRMPGRVARHEVVFGALGQTLTLTHDSISRESFMPGVMMAIRSVMHEKGLIVGLDSVMGLNN